jgi:hypothetical protein
LREECRAWGSDPLSEIVSVRPRNETLDAPWLEHNIYHRTDEELRDLSMRQPNIDFQHCSYEAAQEEKSGVQLLYDKMMAAATEYSLTGERIVSDKVRSSSLPTTEKIQNKRTRETQDQDQDEPTSQPETETAVAEEREHKRRKPFSSLQYRFTFDRSKRHPTQRLR